MNGHTKKIMEQLYKMINGDSCECLKFGKMRNKYEWNHSQR